MENLLRHHKPQNINDRIALTFTKFLRLLADTFFKKKIWPSSSSFRNCCCSTWNGCRNVITFEIFEKNAR